MLHDVGKIAIPDEILNRRGPLSDAEWAFVRDHTMVGERILRDIPFLSSAASAVRSAHERWDGGGYRTASPATTSRCSRASSSPATPGT